MGGVDYVQVAAGASHTVFLRSDGQAVAVGANKAGQCNLPKPEDGDEFPDRYIQVSAGACHTVLLRSDGCAIAVGDNSHGQCDVPGLELGMCYIASQLAPNIHGLQVVLQLHLEAEGMPAACGLPGVADMPGIARPSDSMELVCRTLAGEVRA